MLALGAKTMGPEMLGRWGLATAVVSPIAIFGSLNLRGLLATDIKHHWSLTDYFQLRIFGSVLTAILTLVIAPLVSQDPVVWACMALVLVQRTFEGASEMQYGALQRAHHNRIIGQSFLGRSVISLSAFAAILYTTRSLVWALTAQAIAGVIMYWSFDRVQSIRLGVRPQSLGMEWPRSRQEWKAWYAVRRPLIVGQAIPYSWLALTPALMAAAPRWMLGRADVAALGYFTALIYGPTAMSLVAGALGQTIQPRLAAAWHENNVTGIITLLRRSVLLVALLGSVAVITVLLIGDTVLTYLYRPDYAAYTTLLVWMTVGGASQMVGTLAGYSLSAWRRVTDQQRSARYLLGLNFLLSVALIPHWKFAGAVAAVVITNVAQMLSVWFLVRRSIGICKARSEQFTSLALAAEDPRDIGHDTEKSSGPPNSFHRY